MSAGGPVGDRASFLRLVNSLLDTYKPEGVLSWLGSESESLRAKFGGRAPRDLIRAGDWQPLLDEADRLAGGALAADSGTSEGQTPGDGRR